MENKEILVLVENRVQLDLKGQLELKVKRVLKVNLETLVLKESKV